MLVPSHQFFGGTGTLVHNPWSQMSYKSLSRCTFLNAQSAAFVSCTTGQMEVVANESCFLCRKDAGRAQQCRMRSFHWVLNGISGSSKNQNTPKSGVAIKNSNFRSFGSSLSEKSAPQKSFRRRLPWRRRLRTRKMCRTDKTDQSVMVRFKMMPFWGWLLYAWLGVPHVQGRNSDS